jgi:hypothetical protein
MQHPLPPENRHNNAILFIHYQPPVCISHFARTMGINYAENFSPYRLSERFIGECYRQVLKPSRHIAFSHKFKGQKHSTYFAS